MLTRSPVISAATGALKTAASIRTTHTTLVEEFAITLALTQLPCTTILSDTTLAILRFATNQLVPATLRICTASRAPTKLARLTRFPPTPTYRTAELLTGMRRRTPRYASSSVAQSYMTPHVPSNSPPPNPRRTSHTTKVRTAAPDLPRAESTILHQLQTEAIWTPVFAKHICPMVYPTDHCQHCNEARATTPHLLWDCRPPEDTQDPMPPSMALAIRSDDIGHQRGTVRQVMDILARLRP
ncbi:hypothetical protein HPB48_006773 [Haemaphysalis longicornis]|uniref:Tick transposon n=1 Tax=Haemaphysalis longicornis TaxID=44386 RepID=A0A9J6FRY3_HAELO|nr:hypothetical protein HPB48_006773 [Haemaphysalis longicornis]